VRERERGLLRVGEEVSFVSKCATVAERRRREVPRTSAVPFGSAGPRLITHSKPSTLQTQPVHSGYADSASHVLGACEESLNASFVVYIVLF